MHVATITIDHLKVAGDLTDFVVAIIPDSGAGWAELYATALEGGGDIRIFKAGGVTEIPRENVSFSVSAETGEIHAKFTGTLSGSVDTDIEIHADGSSSDYAVGATNGRNNVWNNFHIVYHMNDTTTSTITDSTGNGNDGTKGAANQPAETSATIGDGQDFSGGNYKIDIDETTAWQADNTGTVTLFLNQPSSNNNETWFGFGSSATTGTFCQFGYRGDESPEYVTMAIRTNGSGNQVNLESRASLVLGSYAHYAISQDGTAMKMYIDGVEDTGAVFTIEDGSEDRASWLNNLDDTYGINQPTLGVLSRTSDIVFSDPTIDEFRIAKDADSADWVATEKNNWSNPTTFYSVAAETGGGAPAQNSAFLMFM